MNYLKGFGLAVLLVVGVFGIVKYSSATAYDWHFSIKNGTDDGDIAYDLPIPLDTTDRIITLNGFNKFPMFTSVGTGLVIDGDGLSVSNIPVSRIVQLQQILNSINTATSTLFGTVDANSATLASLTGTVNELATSTLIQRIRVQTNTSGTYTWTFPVAYGTSTIPVIEVTPEDSTSAASTDVRIVSVSNTQIVVQASRITTVLGLLNLNATPQIYVHISAMKP